MTTGDDGSITVPQEGSRAGRRNATAILLMVGSAHEAGATQAPRLLRLPLRLEVGRAHGGAEGEAGQGGERLDLRDKLLSRVHLRLERTPGGCEVEDAGSLNGTFLEGRRLAERARLSDGALLVFGAHAAVFRRAADDALDAIAEELATPLGPVATTSPQLALVLWRLRRLARSGTEVLLSGETGSGKEVYARAVHAASGRPGRFVAINCAAIPAELAESELFGYARGAHSTATEPKPGLIQAAEGGTLFLDEIGDMPPRLQAKLLRFLQDREVTPLGSTTARKIDVQILAATNNPGLTGGGGDLRADLAARLGAQAIRIPPLRDRIEDLGALIHLFLQPTAVREIEPSAFHALCLYTWPRNVRELAKVIAEAVALGEGAPTLKLSHLPDAITAIIDRPTAAATTTASHPARRSSPTRAELEALLRQHHGNVTHVARAMGRQWAVVWRWLVKYEIDPKEYR